MLVRPVAVADAEAIRAIYNVEVAESTVTFDITPRTATEQLEWIGRHQGGFPALVAIEDGAVTGFGSLSPFRDRAAYRTTVENSVYVDRAWRRRGVGRLLLDALVLAASDHGFHSVIARISGGNQASVDLHLACGFALVGVEHEVGRKFNRWLDVTILERLL